MEFTSIPQEDTLEAELTHTGELMAVVEKYEEILALPAVSQKYSYLKEAVDDVLERLDASSKGEARVRLRQRIAPSMVIRAITL